MSVRTSSKFLDQRMMCLDFCTHDASREEEKGTGDNLVHLSAPSGVQLLLLPGKIISFYLHPCHDPSWHCTSIIVSHPGQCLGMVNIDQKIGDVRSQALCPDSTVYICSLGHNCQSTTLVTSNQNVSSSLVAFGCISNQISPLQTDSN